MKIQIKDGDIFRWRYKDEKPDDLGAYKRYHCKSQIAVAKLGMLADTFWGGPSANVFWPYSEAPLLLDLVPLGNLNDLENRPEYEAAIYADADCVDLNHANSSRGNFYIRKGATRCREKMRETLTERIADATREAAFAEHKRTMAVGLLAAVDAGDDLNTIYV